MEKNPLHRSNFLLLLLVSHFVAGFPSDFLRRQLTDESFTDGPPDWFRYGITGLDAAADAISGWIDDLVFPNVPALDPVAVPSTTTIDGNNRQDDLSPDIELETIVAPMDFGNDCKQAALPGEQVTMVCRCLKRLLSSTARVG